MIGLLFGPIYPSALTFPEETHMAILGAAGSMGSGTFVAEGKGLDHFSQPYFL